MLSITGGIRLAGEYRLESAKNAVLPIMAACVMIDEPVTLLDVPDIADVETMLDILRDIGCDVTKEGPSVTIHAAAGMKASVPKKLGETLRSSIFLAGPLLVRCGSVVFGHPGGCEIGLRPIDLHEQGLRELGASIANDGGLICCTARNMRGANIRLEYPSVGATENIMMAACITDGVTRIDNAAREPEIVDLARFLNVCGARISGAGKHTIVISGVKRLHGATYKPIPDRIVAGTLMAACAITGGELRLTNASAEDMAGQSSKLRDMGCDIYESGDIISMRAPKRLRSFGKLETLPHPGFPTDMQAPMFSLATVADGKSVIMETIFESRFSHADDLRMMGADAVVVKEDRMAMIRGVPKLHGAHVKARDLRGGAALVVAGLAAEGETVIEDVHHIDRGYASIEKMLAGLGARIARSNT